MLSVLDLDRKAREYPGLFTKTAFHFYKSGDFIPEIVLSSELKDWEYWRIQNLFCYGQIKQLEGHLYPSKISTHKAK